MKKWIAVIIAAAFAGASINAIAAAPPSKDQTKKDAAKKADAKKAGKADKKKGAGK